MDARELASYDSELSALIERYTADREALGRYFGDHDDTVSAAAVAAVSTAHNERMARFYAEWQTALDRVEFDKLGQDGRIDYILLRNNLSRQNRRLKVHEAQFAAMEPLIPFASAIIELEDARRAMKPVDPEKAAGVLAAIAKQIGELRKADEAHPPKVAKPVANRASAAAGDMRNILRAWFGFYDGYDPEFTWWAGEPYKKADQSLQDYAAFVREKLAGIAPDDHTSIVGDPIGREALLAELADETIPYTPEELIAIAKAEFAWCEKEMARASGEMGYGDDWHKALEAVKTRHAAPGGQPEALHKLALEAIDFTDRHELVTIPPLARDAWRMEMIPPDRQLLTPFFTGGEVLSISFPTNGMTHEQKLMSMRGNNLFFSRATVMHEVVPGHHLQLFMQARYRAYRGAFNTPFLVEGWAMYWETLFWDLGWDRMPEQRIAALFWRMHRCARVIFTLSFHMGKMTPEECVDFLVNRVGHERDNATAEVRRSFDGSYEPLYQCAYLLGALGLRALHREMVASGKMTERDFHDAVLRENAIPIELIRASLGKQKLMRDYRTNWKFYGPAPAAE
jgi:uncharacterized protein (DUF885 family)